MSGKAPSNVEYLFSWDREPLLFNLASIDVSPEYCEKPEGRQALVHLFDELVRLCDPVFGAVCYYPPANDNMAQLVDLRIRLPQPGWILYLGRPYISLFGEEWLLSAPCQEVQRLASGHIKLRLAETPFSVDVKVRQQLREYLGPDAFVEEGKSIRRYKTGFAPVFDFSAKTAFEP